MSTDRSHPRRRRLVAVLAVMSAGVLILVAAAVAAPPAAVSDSVVTDEDTELVFDVLANDLDADGDSLTVTGTTSPSHGTVVCTADGVCRYMPNQDYHGVDGFSYEISDGTGSEDVGVVDITVISVNDPPRADTDMIATDEDTPATVNVLANDSDVDGDTLQVTGTSSTVRRGTFTCTLDGDCVFTPAPGYSGGALVTYTIRDGNGGTDTADVDVTVAPVNDPPDAVDDALTTRQNTAGFVDVLANDTDPEGDPLFVSAVTNGDHGLVHCPPSGACSYVPAAGYSGPDLFTYAVADDKGGTDTATVHVTVRTVAQTGRVAGKGTVAATTLNAIGFRVDAGASGGFFAFDGNGVRFASTSVEHVTVAGAQAAIRGHGTWNRVPGYVYEATFVDAGFPGRSDTIDLVVRDPDGAVAFSTAGPRLLKRGNVEVAG